MSDFTRRDKVERALAASADTVPSTMNSEASFAPPLQPKSTPAVHSSLGNLLRVPAVRARLGGMPHSTFYDRLDPNSERYDSDLPKPQPYLGGRAVYVLEADLDAYIEKKVMSKRS